MYSITLHPEAMYHIITASAATHCGRIQVQKSVGGK